MTIIQYRDDVPEWAAHSADADTGELQEVWVEAWDERYACLRESSAVTLRHERVDKSIEQVLAHREWTPLSGVPGYDEVVGVLG